SYAYQINNKKNKSWSDLCIGLLIISSEQKSISSREAMLNTVKTSKLYQTRWCKQISEALKFIKEALDNHDFELLGQTAENNAIAMHATMLDAKPSILYSNKNTIDAMHKIWNLRKQGIKVFFTQ